MTRSDGKSEDWNFLSLKHERRHVCGIGSLTFGFAGILSGFERKGWMQGCQRGPDKIGSTWGSGHHIPTLEAFPVTIRIGPSRAYFGGKPNLRPSNPFPPSKPCDLSAVQIMVICCVSLSECLLQGHHLQPCTCRLGLASIGRCRNNSAQPTPHWLLRDQACIVHVHSALPTWHATRVLGYFGGEQPGPCRANVQVIVRPKYTHTTSWSFFFLLFVGHGKDASRCAAGSSSAWGFHGLPWSMRVCSRLPEYFTF